MRHALIVRMSVRPVLTMIFAPPRIAGLLVFRTILP